MSGEFTFFFILIDYAPPQSSSMNLSPSHFCLPAATALTLISVRCEP